MHIKRVRAEIKVLASKDPAAAVTEARVILNDLSAKGMGLFSTAAMMVGQDVAITLDEPRRVYLRGRITWCEEYDAGSHILSSHPFHFRVGVKFVFQTRDEEESVAAFYDEIVRSHLFTDAA